MENQKIFRIAVRKFGPFESALEKIWKSFCTEMGCDVTVEMVPMDLHPLYHEILESGGLRNGTWDVAHINTDWLYEAYTSGAIENLTPYIKNNPPEDFPNGWSNSLLSMQQFGQDVAGLPFHDGPECLIYRKDLFEDEKEKNSYFNQYGKSLQPPQTWDDFQQIAQFFQRPEQKLYGAVFAGYPDGHNTVFDFSLQLWTRNGELVNENATININSDAALQGLTFYRSIFQDTTAIHPHSKEYDSVQAGMAFARGEVAMMVNWFGFASMCEVIEESTVKGKVDITTIPKGPSGASASLNVYWLYAIGAGSNHKQLAYEFIRFAVNRHNDKLLTLEGGIGCRLSTWHDQEVNAIVPYYHKLEQLHQNAKSLPLKSNWAKIATVIDEVVLQTVNTHKPITELLHAGQQKIELLDQNEKHGHIL
ncbi:MAG: extracellular solute-binding protein [Flavisolibacter sp.]|nr:extracellular solute-binding protein [Flavisolibacter sp.]